MCVCTYVRMYVCNAVLMNRTNVQIFTVVTNYNVNSVMYVTITSIQLMNVFIES